MLAAEGATVVEFPSILISPPPEPRALEEAVDRIETFRWIVFTHVSATRIFLDRLVERLGTLRPLAEACRLAAVGHQRRRAVEAYGLTVEVAPQRASPSEVVEALAEAAGDLAGVPLLVVSGESSSPVLSQLEDLGAEVTMLQAAQRTASLERADEVTALMEGGRVSGVVFLSPGGVNQIRRALEVRENLARAIAGVLAYAMSPRTARRARALGFADVRVPQTPTREALLEMVCEDVL